MWNKYRELNYRDMELTKWLSMPPQRRVHLSKYSPQTRNRYNLASFMAPDISIRFGRLHVLCPNKYHYGERQKEMLYQIKAFNRWSKEILQQISLPEDDIGLPMPQPASFGQLDMHADEIHVIIHDCAERIYQNVYHWIHTDLSGKERSYYELSRSRSTFDMEDMRPFFKILDNHHTCSRTQWDNIHQAFENVSIEFDQNPKVACTVVKTKDNFGLDVVFLDQSRPTSIKPELSISMVDGFGAPPSFVFKNWSAASMAVFSEVERLIVDEPRPGRLARANHEQRHQWNWRNSPAFISTLVRIALDQFETKGRFTNCMAYRGANLHLNMKYDLKKCKLLPTIANLKFLDTYKHTDHQKVDPTERVGFCDLWKRVIDFTIEKFSISIRDHALPQFATPKLKIQGPFIYGSLLRPEIFQCDNNVCLIPTRSFTMPSPAMLTKFYFNWSLTFGEEGGGKTNQLLPHQTIFCTGRFYDHDSV
jgi:hypothetical protein